MRTLHMDLPMNHVSVTSQRTVGGKQNRMTKKSATARFTMKILVTVRIVWFVYTAMHTNALPTCKNVFSPEIRDKQR